jgi:hypothetical protein
MSALRQLLASLWTVVWLHWRLLAVRARRRFGRRPPAAGPGYRPIATEIPVEGVDYDVAQLPADLAARLAAPGAELLDHARAAATRPARRRARARRTASLATAALLTLGVVGAGATALVTGSTGVPAIDRMLGYNVATRDDGDSPSRRAVSPAPSTTSRALAVPFEVDGEERQVVATSYRNQDGGLCLAVTTDADDTSIPQGGGGCPSLAYVRRQVGARWVVVSGVYADRTAALVGYASADVENVEIDGPKGPLTVRLSTPWSPEGQGGDPVRFFLAASPVGYEGDDLDAEEFDRLSDLDGYSVRARLADGMAVDVAP